MVGFIEGDDVLYVLYVLDVFILFYLIFVLICELRFIVFIFLKRKVKFRMIK